MRTLRDNSDTAIMLITHDLGVVAEMCDRVVVMYAGRVVEVADVDTLFENPQHPYTKGLIASVPKLGSGAEKLDSIPGNLPNPQDMPQGCKFAPRCKFAMDTCLEREPELKESSVGHSTRCWLTAN